MKKLNWYIFLRKLTLIIACGAALTMFLYGLREGLVVFSRGARVFHVPVSPVMQAEIAKIRQEKGSSDAPVTLLDILTDTEKTEINRLLADGTLYESNMRQFLDRFWRAPNRENAVQQARDTRFRAEVARNKFVVVELLFFSVFSAALGFFTTWGVYYVLYFLYQWLWESSKGA